ncbi:hypothetical protein SAMN05428969_1047 [Devosia sp. YR412]|uniref:hypothetical protein n=1 Tax=Devosia sp. YR412 TaxID=1881030 RepID=UPI0008C1977F|nr:hypothetical protein [Devosia sp. YR412]SEP81904.1 hypothetical protein SAMN05428969_1047 [Devosia sp. YR412]
MLDLEFIANGPALGSLVLYRYRHEHLRRAVLAKIQQGVAASGNQLVLCDQSEFVRRIHGEGLFVSKTEVPFLDWSEFLQESLRRSGLRPAVLTDSDELSSWMDGGESSEQDQVDYGLGGLVEMARHRPSGSPSAILLVDQVFVEDWWHDKSADELQIDSVADFKRADLPALVRALADGQDTIRLLKLNSVAQEAWNAGYRSGDMVEIIDTASVALLANPNWSLPDEEKANQSARLSKSVMEDVIFGAQTRRLEVIETLLLTGFSGARILRELVLATMRARPSPSASQGADGVLFQLSCHRWAVWLGALLKRAPSLASAEDNSDAVWTRPDRRLSSLFYFLSEFQRVQSIANAWDEDHERLVEAGARWLRSNFLDLSERISNGLEGLKYGNGEAEFKYLSRDAELLVNAQSWLTKDADEVTAREEAKCYDALESLSELDGQSTLKSMFLRPFDHRLENDRAYKKPFLLVGEPEVGKRRAADILARLFICEKATVETPRVCGNCAGCHSTGFRIANVDTLDIVDLGDMKDFLRGRARNRGTVMGPPVTVLHNIDYLPGAMCLELLKSYESAFGTGLTIFTATDKIDVDAALMSRCVVVHLWPHRP